MKILVLRYQSGLMEYIPKDDGALDFILANFDLIDEIVEVEQAERVELCRAGETMTGRLMMVETQDGEREVVLFHEGGD